MKDDLTPTQYLSTQKKAALEAELKQIREEKIPELAKRIDEAKQMGDLSENAEYHTAREEMAWAQGRVKDIEHILQNVHLIISQSSSSYVEIGSQVTVSVQGKTKTYTIVGAQEADPLTGKISNESPLGKAFLGKKKGEAIEVVAPSGKQVYTIIAIGV